jgi:hypothetical protein
VADGGGLAAGACCGLWLHEVENSEARARRPARAWGRVGARRAANTRRDGIITCGLVER